MEITIEKKDKIMHVNIKGDLYLNTLKDFEAGWSDFIKGDPEIIAINCKDIVFIDSSALGSLAQLLKYLMGKNIKLVFYDLSIAVDNIFKLTRLDKFFKVTTKEQLQREYERG